jgi:hypothetical protein
MYLAIITVFLELESEVTSTDRQKVLRSIRDRVRSHFGSRVTTRTDEDSAIAIATFDDGYHRLQARIAEITDTIEDSQQARISSTEIQNFSLYEGRFEETPTDSPEDEPPPNSRLAFGNLQAKTMVYDRTGDDSSPGEVGKNEFVGKFNRKKFRLPIRKP